MTKPTEMLLGYKVGKSSKTAMETLCVICVLLNLIPTEDPGKVCQAKTHPSKSSKFFVTGF